MSLYKSDADSLVEAIPDGASLVMPSDTNGVPMAAVRALIRKEARDLMLIGGPTSGLAADLLIGAGCVKQIESAAVNLGEYGGAPRFRAAADERGIAIRETTCPAIHAGLQAAEKGIPFIPLRGLIGSDVQRLRDDWKLIDNPFAPDGMRDPIALLPAITPDIALIHAACGDDEGNVWIGLRREVLTMAHAARITLATVEKRVSGSLLDDPATASGTISSLYIDHVASCPSGAWPVGFANLYGPDGAHMSAYAKQAKTAAGFAAYLDEHVLNEQAVAAE
jgi:glutaconate CoA-transferase, subunit A